jgi:hypothetical protein
LDWSNHRHLICYLDGEHNQGKLEQGYIWTEQTIDIYVVTLMGNIAKVSKKKIQVWTDQTIDIYVVTLMGT